MLFPPSGSKASGGSDRILKTSLVADFAAVFHLNQREPVCVCVCVHVVGGGGGVQEVF